MLDQDSDKPLNGTKCYTMNHNRTVLFSVCSDIFQLKPLGHLKIQLDGSALPGPSDGIYQMEINFRPIKRTVPLIHHIVQTQLRQSRAQTFCGHLPILVTSHTVLRTGRQLHMILEAKQRVHRINQLCHSHNLILDLLRSHKDMSIILGKAAHPHQAMKLTGFLMAVNQSQLSHSQGQIPIRARLRGIGQHPARTVHRLHCIILLINHRGIHVVLIVIPVSGSLPQASVENNRRGNLYITGFFMNFPPVFQKRIL